LPRDARVHGRVRYAGRHRHREAGRRLRRADPRAPGPEAASADRDDDGRQVLRRPDHRSAHLRVPRSGFPARPHHEAARGHRRLCGRGRRAPPPRRRTVRALVQKGAVRALLALIAAAAAAGTLALPAAGRQAADECRGLMVCIPVAGPWVVIPSPARPTQPISAAWQLKCPEGGVAGLGARLTDRTIDMSSSGRLGSPVNPGITTTNTVVFTGTYTGDAVKATSFRPFIGCIPAAGGGRTPTAFKPGAPTVVRSKTVHMQQGKATTAVIGCA